MNISSCEELNIKQSDDFLKIHLKLQFSPKQCLLFPLEFCFSNLFFFCVVAHFLRYVSATVHLFPITTSQTELLKSEYKNHSIIILPEAWNKLYK